MMFSFSFLLFVLLGCWGGHWIYHPTHATSLSFLLNTKEECFYVLAPSVQKKIGLYFAVQSGGQFDLNFFVKDPTLKIVIEGTKQRQGDYVFAAQHVGEYTVCFENENHLTSSKQVNLDLTVEDEHLSRPSFPSTPTMPSSMTSSKLSENTLELENGMYRISHLLTSYARNQKYYRTRENRNQDTVLTIQSRIGWFAFLESCLIVMMSLAQVYFVRAFFNVGSLKSKF